MSNAEGREEALERQGFQALDEAIVRALDELKSLRQRALDAEGRRAELEELLKSFESGEETAGGMRRRLTHLEKENHDLRSRVGQGRETVERMLARIGFLEDQK